MSRVLPKTMLGQVMLVLAFGLLVGQLVSANLLFRASEQRRELTIVNELALRFVNAERRQEAREDREASRPERRGQNRHNARRRGARNGTRVELRSGIEITNASPILSGDERLAKLEPVLQTLLQEQGITTTEIFVARRKAGTDHVIEQRPLLRERLGGDDWRNQSIAIAAIKKPGSDQWQVARIFNRQPGDAAYPLLIQTLVIFCVLFALMYLMMRRITRPLASLTERVDAFSRNPDNAVQLVESGPQDTRQLIAAHNAMEARVSALLDEKDVMLGAIGHDLKTPLAALRVRIESVPGDTQRKRMAQSIEDITQTLDDILSLARIGRSGVEAEHVDLSALTASLVEECEDLNQPVTLLPTVKYVREVQVTWIKRALRNLVSNAVRYGTSATVSLHEEAGAIIFRIDDEGPGIPEADIANMLEPFQRAETSRNRETGGAGLGLTLARAIAEQHGGTLTLTNQTQGQTQGQTQDAAITGLRAEIRLP